MAMTHVKSEITGKVWKIEVPKGGRVEQDEPVMILEAMKMEIPVLAPVGGTVADIRVAEGDAVAEGQVVAVIE